MGRCGTRTANDMDELRKRCPKPIIRSIAERLMLKAMRSSDPRHCVVHTCAAWRRLAALSIRYVGLIACRSGQGGFKSIASVSACTDAANLRSRGLLWATVAEAIRARALGNFLKVPCHLTAVAENLNVHLSRAETLKHSPRQLLMRKCRK